MAASELNTGLILGEHRRTLDERFRLSLPPELIESFSADATCILAKERAGCLSLWNAERWQAKLNSGKELLEAKVRAGRLDARLEELQLLGRLLSSRHTNVQLAGRGRLVIPEGFREFLGVEPGGEMMIVGAAVSIELWRMDAWTAYLNERMPDFRRLFDELSG